MAMGHGNSSSPQRPELGLFTDLYELTMLQAYLDESMDDEAVFSLFVRRLPATRNFLLACGIETALECLENISFQSKDLAYLESLGLFDSKLLQWLADFRFRGDVYGLPEGSPVFANEPLLEVVAPLPQAQLVETLVMNQVHLQTLAASKAVRVVNAAGGRPVVDFGARRVHGIDAGLKSARAMYIAGVSATSNLLAGKHYRIPVSGTMAHSYVQAHDDETSAFRLFSARFPNCVLLVDTYDTLAGVGRVVDLARSLGDGFQVRGIRLDSGDLAELAKQSRSLLDQAGLQGVQIFASGSLDEDRIARLLATGAPIDGFGVGTRMGVSTDAPDLDFAYKLTEYAGRGRLKLSAGKPVLPGRKQVFRVFENGEARRDWIGRAQESLEGEPLLVPLMKQGRRCREPQNLERLREKTRQQVRQLPARLRETGAASPYPVKISEELSRYKARVEAQVVTE